MTMFLMQARACFQVLWTWIARTGALTGRMDNDNVSIRLYIHFIYFQNYLLLLYNIASIIVTLWASVLLPLARASYASYAMPNVNYYATAFLNFCMCGLLLCISHN